MPLLQRSAFAIALVGAFALAACKKADEAPAAPTVESLQTDAQKFAYLQGVDMGKTLARFKEDVDIKSLHAGIDVGYAGGESVIDPKQREEIMQRVAQNIQKKQAAEAEAEATKGKVEGETFLAENGKKPNIKTTASGLQYEVLAEGTGDAPKATDTVTVNYKGTFIDGKTFDSSYDRGQPATFPVQGVIPGWTEALQLMKPGAKYRLFIPSNLAYGPQGNRGIPPNSTLLFEVELISIGEPKPAAAAEPAKK